MKKIINGKRYDTDSAKECGSYYYSNRRDFHYLEETLYQKRTGEFFLHGVGGPASKYAEYDGNNSWSGGEKIIPLSLEGAQKWAEENLDADEYESIFGEVTEEEEKRTVTFSLSEDVIKKIRIQASEKGMTMSAYVESLVR